MSASGRGSTSAPAPLVRATGKDPGHAARASKAHPADNRDRLNQLKDKGHGTLAEHFRERTGCGDRYCTCTLIVGPSCVASVSFTTRTRTYPPHTISTGLNVKVLESVPRRSRAGVPRALHECEQPDEYLCEVVAASGHGGHGMFDGRHRTTIRSCRPASASGSALLVLTSRVGDRRGGAQERPIWSAPLVWR